MNEPQSPHFPRANEYAQDPPPNTPTNGSAPYGRRPGRRTLKDRIRRNMLSDSMTSTASQNSVLANHQERLFASMTSHDLHASMNSAASLDVASSFTAGMHIGGNHNAQAGGGDKESVLAAASALASLGVTSPSSSVTTAGTTVPPSLASSMNSAAGGLKSPLMFNSTGLRAPQRRGTRRGRLSDASHSSHASAPVQQNQANSKEVTIREGYQLHDPAAYNNVPASAPPPTRRPDESMTHAMEMIRPPPNLTAPEGFTAEEKDRVMNMLLAQAQAQQLQNNNMGQLKAARGLNVGSQSNSMNMGMKQQQQHQQQMQNAPSSFGMQQAHSNMNAHQHHQQQTNLNLRQQLQPTNRGLSIPTMSPPSEVAVNRPFASLLGSDIPLTFPQKLMEVLSNPQTSDIITWLPHGKGFIILQKRKFALDVMPLYFKHSKFTSFTRKLNRWGFSRVSRGPEMGAYYHKFFQRGNYLLCMQMHCQSTNKSAAAGKGKEGEDEKDGGGAKANAKGDVDMDKAGTETENATSRASSQEPCPMETGVIATAMSSLELSKASPAVVDGGGDKMASSPSLSRTMEYNRLSKLGVASSRPVDTTNAPFPTPSPANTTSPFSSAVTGFGQQQPVASATPAFGQRQQQQQQPQSFGVGSMLPSSMQSPPVKSSMKGSGMGQQQPLQQEAGQMSIDPVLGMDTSSSRNHALVIANALDALKSCNDQALLTALMTKENGKAAPSTSPANTPRSTDNEGPSTYEVQSRVHAAMQAQLRRLEECNAEQYNRMQGAGLSAPPGANAQVGSVHRQGAAPGRNQMGNPNRERSSPSPVVQGAVHDNILRAAMLQRMKKLDKSNQQRVAGLNKVQPPTMSQGGVAQLYNQINARQQQQQQPNSGMSRSAQAAQPQERKYRAVRRASAA